MKNGKTQWLMSIKQLWKMGPRKLLIVLQMSNPSDASGFTESSISQIE
jgi:hypothetical protein